MIFLRISRHLVEGRTMKDQPGSQIGMIQQTVGYGFTRRSLCPLTILFWTDPVAPLP
jgi:hypothetical protein